MSRRILGARSSPLNAALNHDLAWLSARRAESHALPCHGDLTFVASHLVSGNNCAPPRNVRARRRRHAAGVLAASRSIVNSFMISCQ